MFNLARHLHGEIPEQFKPEDFLFKSKPKMQNLKEDVEALKRVMVEHGLSNPEDALEIFSGIGHWQYLSQFRPRYVKEVMEAAKATAKGLAHEFHEHPEKFPMPPPPQGGAGGGAGGAPGGAMGASEKRIVNASYVLPDGSILVKEGHDYMVHDKDNIIEFYSEAGPQAAMAIAMIRLAAKGQQPDEDN